MTGIQEHYAELLTLTRLHLTQHYESKSAITADPDTYTFFRRCAQQQKQQNLTSSSSLAGTLPDAHPITTTKHFSAPPTRPQLPHHLSHADASSKESKIIPSHPIELVQDKKIESKEKITAKNKEKKSASLFNLEPLQQVDQIDLSDIEQIISERFPAQKIIQDIPSDAAAKVHPQDHVMASAEVLILSFSKDPQQMTFLTNLANAISLKLKFNATIVSAADLEHDGQWYTLLKSTLRLVIASGHLIHAYPKLMQYYREEVKKARFYVGKIPLCFYSDISLYFKEPTLKLSLWKSICEHLN